MKILYFATSVLFITTNTWANNDPLTAPSLLYRPKAVGQLTEATAFKSAASTYAAERQIPAYKPDAATSTQGPKRTGTVHTLSEPVYFDKLNWEALTNGGYTIKVKIMANQAKRLRLHLHIRGDYSALEIRLQGNSPSSRIELVTASTYQHGDIWLPITLGDEAILELYAQTRAIRDAISVTLDRVNYLFVSAEDGQFAARGKASYPEYDATCWSDDPAYSVLLDGAASTAMINFVSGQSSYLCTGTLLADLGKTLTPWFATANHCIGSQNEADSMTLEWFYQAPSCGSSRTDQRYKRTAGGAELLWTSPTHDASLLQLNNTPPSGVVYAGWDATPLTIGRNIWGIHHPKGDHTMISSGEVAALNVRALTGSTQHILNEMHYSRGGTESGSSGSGLFSINGATIQWHGTLTGGPAGDYQRSLYSPFSSYYDSIKPYLTSTTPYTPRTETLSSSSGTTFTVNGTLYGDNIDTPDVRLYLGDEICTKIDTNGYSCAIPTIFPYPLPTTENDCGKPAPAIKRVRKSNNFLAAPWIADSYTVAPTTIDLGKRYLCAYSTFSGNNLTITKNGLTFDQKAAKILDCAENVAGTIFPVGTGSTQYDSMLSQATGAASVERSYPATGWASAVLRQSATDINSNFYHYRAPGGGWTNLGDVESINRLYCHAW